MSVTTSWAGWPTSTSPGLATVDAVILTLPTVTDDSPVTRCESGARRRWPLRAPTGVLGK